MRVPTTNSHTVIGARKLEKYDCPPTKVSPICLHGGVSGIAAFLVPAGCRALAVNQCSLRLQGRPKLHRGTTRSSSPLRPNLTRPELSAANSKFGETAVMYAAASGNTETVKVLIENGANGSVLDQHLCGLGVASSRFMTRPARLLRHNPAPAPAVLGEGLQVGFPLDQHSCGFRLAVPVCRPGGLEAPRSSNGSGCDAGAVPVPKQC